jgi:hypothetical protein
MTSKYSKGKINLNEVGRAEQEGFSVNPSQQELTSRVLGVERRGLASLRQALPEIEIGSAPEWSPHAI